MGFGKHFGRSAVRTLRRWAGATPASPGPARAVPGRRRLWPVLALSLAALLGAALAANTASPLQAQTITPTLEYLQLALVDHPGNQFPLRPEFAPGITEYTASVPNRFDQILVDSESGEGSTIAITKDGNTIMSRAANLDLDVGYNTVTVTVTSADGNATNVYTVTVTRASTLPAPTDCPADTDWCATMEVGRHYFFYLN